jgi:RNA polymerase sigma-70 factor (sigma-E family)
VDTAAARVVTVVSSQGGSEDDFDAYVRTERGGLLRYAILLCGSQAQAEDIVQEVLARVYQRWDALDAEAGRKTYLRRSVTNEFLSWRRRWSTRMLTYVDTTDLHDVVDAPRASARDEELWSCLATLPPRQRAAVVLRYYEDLSDTEIATALDCRPSTVRAHLSRALATLRQRPDVRIARENLS